MPSRRTTPRLDQEIPVGPDHLGGSRENVTAVGRIMKGRLRRALFIASLGTTAIAGLAAGTVSAITHAARGNSVAVDLLWTAGGFLLVAFVVVAEGAARRRFHRRGA
jgi:hypothetical protein